MTDLIQITYRNVDPSEALSAEIRDEAKELMYLVGRPIRCQVVVEKPHRHRRHGARFAVHVEVSCANGEVSVGREHDQHGSQNPFVAVSNAFRAARHQVEHQRRNRQRATIRNA